MKIVSIWQLLAAGVQPQHLYEDLASGRREDRPGLTACLKALREGDVLVIWKLDRLGRDLRHLINTMHDLTTQGIGLQVLTGHGAALDTTTATGKLVFGMFRPWPSSSGSSLRNGPVQVWPRHGSGAGKGAPPSK